MALKHFIGKRVEIPVHYSNWARGARTGVVTSCRTDARYGQHLYVKLDHPQVTRRQRIWSADVPYMRLLPGGYDATEDLLKQKG